MPGFPAWFMDGLIQSPTHCAQCGAEYRNIQHPLKPPGVIIQRLCECTPVMTTQQTGPNSVIQITTMVPPEKPT